jgi:hypothetical protein
MVPSFTIYVLFIFSVVLIRVSSKHIKGIPLSKTEHLTLVATAVTLIWGTLAIIADYIVPNLQFPTSPQTAWLIFFILVVITLILSLIALNRSRHVLDYKFKNLSIHYSSRKDSPDKPDPDRPYFVKNEDTKQAYWVSDLIEPYVRQRKIQWFTHDNATALRAYFKSQGVMINQRNPSDEELGLWFGPNRLLLTMKERISPGLLEKLKELKLQGKLRRFQVWFIYPKHKFFLYILSRSWMERDSPPSKWVLVDYERKRAFGAPLEFLQLTEENILDSWSYTPWVPWDTIPHICKHRGFVFNERHYMVNELLEEVEKSESKTNDQ